MLEHSERFTDEGSVLDRLLDGRVSARQFSIYLLENQESVTLLAHYYWILRGCPEGSPEVDWFLAEQTIDREAVAHLDLGLPA